MLYNAERKRTFFMGTFSPGLGQTGGFGERISGLWHVVWGQELKNVKARARPFSVSYTNSSILNIILRLTGS